MGTPQIQRYCENNIHELEGDEPVEADICHTYNDEDHYFCSERCYQNWWFSKQKAAGVDVNTIPLTRNGVGVICNHCNEPVLYGGIKDMQCDFIDNELTLTFCSEDHQTKYHSTTQEPKHGESNG